MPFWESPKGNGIIFLKTLRNFQAMDRNRKGALDKASGKKSFSPKGNMGAPLLGWQRAG